MKKMTKVMATVIAMAMIICGLTACGGEAKSNTIKFGTNAEFPPFEFVAANGVIGQFDGIDIAIAK